MLLSGCIIHAVRRSRANHQRTEPWIDVFLLYVVNTGLLNGIFNAAPAIMVGVNPGDGFKSSAFNSVVCKLYANTLLAVLNSRRLLLSRGMEVLDGKDLGRSILARAGHIAAAERWNVPQAPDNSSRPILVNITAETEDDCHRVLGTHPGKLEPNRRVSTAR
ncbi:hypothetical protein C8Q78DRAFT_303757 [Trametes maxima]|nr:hypothetical protein C8Q78DRAFT_303757 [Trametes maxima]